MSVIQLMKDRIALSIINEMPYRNWLQILTVNFVQLQHQGRRKRNCGFDFDRFELVSR